MGRGQLSTTSRRANPWDAYQNSLKSQRSLVRALLALTLVAALVLGSSTYFAALSRAHLREVLFQNARAAINATCHACAELIDNDLVYTMAQSPNSAADTIAYRHTMANIHNLRSNVGAERIYVVLQDGDGYLCAWDTAAEDSPALVPITLNAVQTEAFTGTLSLDVHTPGDTSAHLNEGALPLFLHGEVIAIVCVEFSNQYANTAYGTALGITNLLTGSLAVMMAAFFVVATALVRHNQRNQQQLFDMANKDVITGLPNRRYLFTYLLNRIEQADPSLHDRPLVAFFIDLDNFKAVNDGAGHDAGDRLLADIGGFLSDALGRVASTNRRECLTARLGGDEFVQLLSDTNLEEAEAYVEELMEDFMQRPGLQDYIERFGINMSTGIAAYPEHTTDSNDLVKYADIAMYHAKSRGKHTYMVYDPNMGSYFEGVTLSVREARK